MPRLVNVTRFIHAEVVVAAVDVLDDPEVVLAVVDEDVAHGT